MVLTDPNICSQLVMNAGLPDSMMGKSQPAPHWPNTHTHIYWSGIPLFAVPPPLQTHVFTQIHHFIQNWFWSYYIYIGTLVEMGLGITRNHKIHHVAWTRLLLSQVVFIHPHPIHTRWYCSSTELSRCWGWLHKQFCARASPGSGTWAALQTFSKIKY